MIMRESDNAASLKLFKDLLLFVFVLMLSTWARAQDTQVVASVGSDTVGVQDQFQLSVTVTGRDSGDAESPRFGNPGGFRIVSGPNVSTQFQWINGRSSSSKSFTYILIPEKEGQFAINPIEVKVGSRIYKTQPISVRVTSASRNAPPARQPVPNPLDPFEEEDRPASRAGDTVIVRAELDKESVYPGQQVTLFYRVYTQLGITGIQLRESPPLSGFWVEDLEVEKNPTGVRQTLNNREYLVYTIKKQALFATTTGRLKIPPSTFAISAGLGGDVLGIFGRTETLYRRTQELSLDVKELPAQGRPTDFSNAVGAFNLTTSMDKTRVSIGEAVALHVKLEGKGNLKMIPDISLPSFPDFTIYSSKRVDNLRSFEGSQIGGDKIWEHIIVPKAPGQQVIPSLSFSYFNTERNKYETINTPPLSLTVLKGSDSTTGSSNLSGSNKQILTRRGTDINFIKLSAGTLKQKDLPLYRKFWFLLIAVVPLAFNAGIICYQRHQSKSAGNATLVRSYRARRNALARLSTAQKEGKQDPRRFYDIAAAALSGYLADKFDLSEIELTGDSLERTLSGKLVPPEILEETKHCLQECDFGRFVSASASAGKMEELRSRIQKNIDAVEKTTF
jgi:hypothetical protein